MSGDNCPIDRSGKGWSFTGGGAGRRRLRCPGRAGRATTTCPVAARGVDVLVIATPDAAIAEVAARVRPVRDHRRRPPVGGTRASTCWPPIPAGRRCTRSCPLPSPEVGRVRLRSGITFAVAGDPVAEDLARLLDGSVVAVDDEHRAAYHAAACIASNHLVALMGQVERVAASAGLDLDTFVGLARAALTDVAELGPAAALTGPAARGDEATLERHRRTLDPAEVPGYEAGVALARRLALGPARPTTTPYPHPVRPARPRCAPSVAGPGGSGPMRIVTSAREFSDALETERALGRSVGLVPTMGALHAGHRSLIERAASECDVVAVTVFVNPLQFDDAADLAAYPRDLDTDAALARAAGASVVFAPPVHEMYGTPPETMASAVHVDGVSEGLEGASRPGHFDGVSTVVAKLFALSGRCRAYFGEKDFQQLAVVRRMVVGPVHPGDDRGVPDGARGRRPGHVEPQRPAVGRPTPRRAGAAPRPARGAGLCRARRARPGARERGHDGGARGRAARHPRLRRGRRPRAPCSARPSCRARCDSSWRPGSGRSGSSTTTACRGATSAVGAAPDLVLVNTGEER